jgi:hypothetical protein
MEEAQMHPLLAASLANSLSRDRVGAARSRRAAKAAKVAKVAAADASAAAEVVIRRATAADAPALARLGALNGDRRAGEALARHAAAHEVLVAEVDGALEAALAVDDGLAVADPFRPSAVHAELLALRARQLGAAPRDRRHRSRVLHPRTS